MPRRRVYVTAFLAVLMLCLQVGPVRPGILEKASQLICLVRTDAQPHTPVDLFASPAQ